MRYLSPKETAAVWGISERRVVALLDGGRVEGAFKHGRDWLIPEEAKKPSDMRRQSAAKEERCFPYLVFSDALSFAPGHADETLEDLRGEEHSHAECAFSILRGEFGKAKEIYRTTHKNSRLRICALNAAIYGAIFVGDYELFDEIYKEFGELRERFRDDEIGSVVIDISTRIILTAMKVPTQPLSLENLPKLPEGTLKALFIANSYWDAFALKDYTKVANSLEMLLAYQESERYTPRDIYLYLTCGICFEVIEQDEKARYFYEKALSLALPDRFSLPFADFIASSNNVLHECIKRRGEDLYGKILTLAEDTYRHYIVIHNRFTKNRASTILSISELGFAQCAVLGMTNKAIAEKLGCSVSTVKLRLEIIFEKLGIHKRSELEEHIF